MINATNQICTALETIGLPVVFENFLDSSTTIPCITYREYDNSTLTRGNTSIEYSVISYHIKVWGKSEADLVRYSEEVDKVMRSLHFKRDIMTELWADNIGQRDMKYRNLAIEHY